MANNLSSNFNSKQKQKWLNKTAQEDKNYKSAHEQSAKTYKQSIKKNKWNHTN